MIRLRRSEERGHANHGWLDTRHTFSFADYHDPEHMGFRSLRVINDDRIAPASGFPDHPHRDMEILSFPVEGALEHRDSMGNGSVIRPGEVQYMSAGTGVVHSEFNPSPEEECRLLQVWILPESRGGRPAYEQRRFPPEERRDRFRLVASPDGREGSLTLRRDAEVYSGIFSPGSAGRHALATGRHAWLQVVRGRLRLGDRELAEGDGAAYSDEPEVSLRALEETELLLFDLP
jgi:redox-sensitive bicupin YhaK (pirin superfamily)